MLKKNILELNRINLDEFHHSEKIPLVLVLDNIRSVYNVGSIFRTSDAFLIDRIVLCGITGRPPQIEIHKTALGAENSVLWSYYEDTIQAVHDLKKQQYEVFAVEQVHGSISLINFKIDKSKKYALIFGNEVKGVQQSVVDNCDGCIEIPQFGTKHSLNVSISAGIVIWDFFNKLKNQI